MLERIIEHTEDPDFNGLPAADLSDETDPHSGFRIHVEIPVVAEVEVINEKEPPSTLRRIARALKDSIYPPAVVQKPLVKEFIPQDEQRLMDLLAFDRDHVELFSRIIDTRESLELSALAVGMSKFDLQQLAKDPENYDSRLDPEITQAWRNRLQDKIMTIAKLERELELKRTTRIQRF